MEAVAEHSICHQYATGRPDGDDAEKLRDFACQIAIKMEADTALTSEIPGNRPYKKREERRLFPRPTANERLRNMRKRVPGPHD